MNKITVLMQGEPSPQWQEWIRRLYRAGFEVSTMDPLDTAGSDFDAISSNAVLLNGMLPRLRMIVTLLRTLRKDLRIIVASERDSFVIRHELMCFEETAYLSGPMTAAAFQAKLEEILSVHPSEKPRQSIRKPLQTAC